MKRPVARDGYWFAPHMFGIGATPVTWQGWALTLGFTALMLVDIRLVPNVVARVSIASMLLVVFIVVTIQKTDGGWRWRWGRDD